MHGNSKNISTTWCKLRLPSNKFTLSLNKGPTEKKKNALCSPCHETTKDNGSLRATEPSQFMSAFSRNAWSHKSHKHLHPPSLTYSSFQKEWRLEHPTFLLGRSLLEWAILNFQGAYNQKMSPMYYIKFNLLLATPILQTKNKKTQKQNKQNTNPAKKTNKKKQPLQPTCVQNIIQPPSLPNEPWHPHRWRKHVVDAKPWRRNPGNTFSNEGEEQPAAGWWEQDEVELLLLFIFWRCVESTVNNMYTIYIDI